MDITAEFSGVGLGDKRLNNRVLRLAQELSCAPSKSFPEALKSDGELEGLYRLLRHETVSMTRLLRPHVRQTGERMQERLASGQTVVVAHDTTTVTMGTDRAGLGRVQGETSAQAFFLHTSLAVALGPADDRVPLGVVHAEPYIRQGRPKRRGTRGHHSEKRHAPQHRESARWFRGVEQAEHAFGQRHAGNRGRVIHVADREADQYTLFSRMVEQGVRFVIRAKHTRPAVLCAMQSDGAKLHRQIQLGHRQGEASRFGPQARGPRQARIEICGARYQLSRPNTDAKRRDAPLETLVLGQVTVREIDPSPDVEPVHWTLWTTEPVDTPEQLALIVDCYRARWMIEEFFKALKSGCGYEKRQLESQKTLWSALGLFLPIAWHLLLLKHLAAQDPLAPARCVLNHDQLQVLKHHRATTDLPLCTALDAQKAVARLGGHLPRNGPPGWQVLSRGFLELLTLEQGFKLATSQHNCDLS